MDIDKAQEIKSWQQFTKFERQKGCALLKCLSTFQDPVLVAGCQRSGTTLVARLLRQSEGMIDFQTSKDEELDGALILCGRVPPPKQGRYCFQTTYVNNCYHEYFDFIEHYKMIWVLREPLSVVWSMIYHWKRYALNNLFRSCGLEYLDEKYSKRFKYLGVCGVTSLVKACCSYVGKTNQLFTIYDQLGRKNLLIVDYDDLVMRKGDVLPAIFEFVAAPYRSDYAERIHKRSTSRQGLLSKGQINYIENQCLPIYQKAKDLMLTD